MTYFSGFGLRAEYEIFDPLLKSLGIRLGSFDIAGFDIGALLAIDCALERLKAGDRVGLVLLLSPRYNKHKMDLNHKPCKGYGLKLNKYRYTRTKTESINQLRLLKNYDWAKIEDLCGATSGLLTILGKNDKIPPPDLAASFFSRFGCVLILKGYDRLLRKQG